MSEVLKEMKERRSIRKYKSEMVPQDVLDYPRFGAVS